MTGQAIAEEARAIIARRQIKHSDIADAIGLSRSQFSRRLSAEVEFTGSELERLAEALDVEPGALFPSRREQARAVA